VESYRFLKHAWGRTVINLPFCYGRRNQLSPPFGSDGGLGAPTFYIEQKLLLFTFADRWHLNTPARMFDGWLPTYSGIEAVSSRAWMAQVYKVPHH